MHRYQECFQGRGEGYIDLSPSIRKRQERYDASRRLAVNDLYFTGNGIDLRKKLHSSDFFTPGFLYEEAAFSMIASNSQSDTISLGPHLIDHMFETSAMSGEVRPDVIKFWVGNKTWAVQELIEMKSGRRTHSGKKLEGFSRLLQRLRQTGNLTYLLNDFLPFSDILPRSLIPDVVRIPPDEEIDITFITPIKTSGIFTLLDAPRFRETSFMRISA